MHRATWNREIKSPPAFANTVNNKINVPFLKLVCVEEYNVSYTSKYIEQFYVHVHYSDLYAWDREAVQR